MQDQSKPATPPIVWIFLGIWIIPVLAVMPDILKWVLWPPITLTDWVGRRFGCVLTADQLLLYTFILFVVLFFVAAYAWTAIERRELFWIRTTYAKERCAVCGFRYPAGNPDHLRFAHGMPCAFCANPNHSKEVHGFG